MSLNAQLFYSFSSPEASPHSVSKEFKKLRRKGRGQRQLNNNSVVYILPTNFAILLIHLLCFSFSELGYGTQLTIRKIHLKKLSVAVHVLHTTQNLCGKEMHQELLCMCSHCSAHYTFCLTTLPLPYSRPSWFS